MSGWVTPTTTPTPGSAGGAGGPVAWAAPEETPGLSVGQLLRGAWRLYRSAGRRLLAVALVPALLQALLTLPTVIVAVEMLKGMASVFDDLSRFRTDPLGLQAEMEAAMRPSTDLAVISGLTGGISLTVVTIGWAALTAAALAVMEGRPFSVGSVFRLVAARVDGIVIPALAIGIVWALIGAASGFLQPTGYTGMTPGQAGLYGLFAIGITILTIGAFVLAVVWSLALPAILVEDLGLRRGLARGAELTRGIRIRLGAAFIVAYIIQALTVGLLATVPALVVGLAARSLEAGVVTYYITLYIGAVLWMPYLPAMLALAYRDRIERAGAARDDSAPDVDAVPAIDDGATTTGDAG
jgi:hypothetical protein